MRTIKSLPLLLPFVVYPHEELQASQQLQAKIKENNVKALVSINLSKDEYITHKRY
jgi:hypothetical protein